MLKKIILLFIVIISLTSLFFLYLYLNKDKTSNTNQTTKEFKDISYSNISSNNILDIYIPNTGKQKYPAVIWIHGGAFKFGSKENPQYLDRFLKEEIIVVSINYRLSSEAIWPAQLEDIKNAINFLGKNSELYSIDKDNIAIFGSSAGGYLSSASGILLSENEDIKIKAVIDWFGPVDFYTMDEDMEKTGVTRKTGKNGDANSPESALMGFTISENKDLSDKASLLSYLNSVNDIPNFLIMHGAIDPMIGAPQSEKLFNAIKQKFGEDRAKYYLLPGGTHGGGDFEKDEIQDIVVNFLKDNLYK